MNIVSISCHWFKSECFASFSFETEIYTMFTKGQPTSPGLGRRWSNGHKLLWSLASLLLYPATSDKRRLRVVRNSG